MVLEDSNVTEKDPADANGVQVSEFKAQHVVDHVADLHADRLQALKNRINELGHNDDERLLALIGFKEIPGIEHLKFIIGEDVVTDFNNAKTSQNLTAISKLFEKKLAEIEHTLQAREAKLIAEIARLNELFDGLHEKSLEVHGSFHESETEKAAPAEALYHMIDDRPPIQDSESITVYVEKLRSHATKVLEYINTNKESVISTTLCPRNEFKSLEDVLNHRSVKQKSEDSPIKKAHDQQITQLDFTINNH